MALAAHAFALEPDCLDISRQDAGALIDELLAFHERFPSLFDASSEPKLLFALDGDLLAANASALKLLQRRLSVVRGDRFVRGFSRYMGSFEREAFAIAKSGRTARVATTIARPDGGLIALEATLFPAIVDDTTVGVYVSALDVTSRMERERATARRIQELSSLFEHHAQATMSVDAIGRIRSINAAGERLLGYEPRDLIGEPYAAFVFADGLAHTNAMMERVMKGETATGVTAVRHKSGERIDLAGVVIPIFVDDRVVGAYAVGDDRAHLRGENERIRELYLLAANPTQSAEAQLSMALDIGRRRLHCREAYVARAEGPSLVQMHGAGRWSRREGERRLREGSTDDLALRAGEPICADATGGEGAIVAPIIVGGQAFGTLAFVAPDAGFFAPDDVDYVRLVSTLVSAAIDRAQQHRRLDTLAFYDALTGLPNRAQLADRLADTISRAGRDSSVFALHFFDLDGFKAINDAHGHSRGDDVIALMGQRLERIVAHPNVVARVGGDEFVVVQPDVRDPELAREYARTLCASIGEAFDVEGRTYRLSASVGIAFFPGDGKDSATLLARADLALYKVKASGRNAVAFAGELG